MTTAREQAREAGRTYGAHWGDNIARVGAHAANAASDVWEPLVKDSIKLLEDLASWMLDTDSPYNDVITLLERLHVQVGQNP